MTFSLEQLMCHASDLDSNSAPRIRPVPQLLNTAQAQHQRQVRIDGRWFCDFASCNYLGFDLHPQVQQAIPVMVEQWGTHPSWTRAVASPQPYRELERKLAEQVGVTETLVFPSLTLLHMGVIPLLAERDSVIFLDQAAHRSIYEACRLARQGGATVVRYRHNNLPDLTRKLEKYANIPNKLIAVDGVYSMGADCSPLPDYLRLANQFDARLYIDDAHGFGLLGANPNGELPYGYGGSGVVNFFGLQGNAARIIYCAGLSKAFSSLGAFITCPDESTKNRLATAWTAIFSGPIPVASLASAIAALKINKQEGDRRRQQIYRLTKHLVTAAREIGFEVDNQSYLPIVSVVVGDKDRMMAACQQLWWDGILVTPAIYPAVPTHRNALRFSVTAANTDREIERAVDSLKTIQRYMTLSKAA